MIRTTLAALLLVAGAAPAAEVQRPEAFFGFAIGTDGELARYPRVLDYMRHLAESTPRVSFEVLGETTLGNPYALVTISSAENLARLDRLVEINRKLADPRGLTEDEARRLSAEGRPFYFLYATIHSTEMGNGQAVVEIAHRLATDDSRPTKEILDNAVLLLVPSQNPDGQVLLVDHWYETKGTGYERVYPDLYHKYVGHDDNRDWFMLTQKETRLAIQKVHNAYRPHLTHDMHQTSPRGARIFVPPFTDPYDPNVHPILTQQQSRIGMAMASDLVAEGKAGVVWRERYDLWTPARQYMVYHGQPRILTEIASVNLADPYRDPQGRPLGVQERSWNYPLPYRESEWRLRQIVEYGMTAVFAGLSHMAKYREEWLFDFYRVHRDWVEREEPPYAFVAPAGQRDPFETYEMLEILDAGDVEIHRARSPFTAAGKTYSEGAYVVKTAQPYGAFAKTMLEQQVYPDLRYFPGGPPIAPYDVTGHTLWMLMGVQVDEIPDPFEADLELVSDLAPARASFPSRPRWAYVLGAESNAGFLALGALQKERQPVFRAASAIEAGGKRFAPGAFLVPPSDASERILRDVARRTGMEVAAAAAAVNGAGYRMKLPTRVGLFKGANNMPGGWLLWLFEQYGLDHRIVTAMDFSGDLAKQYDAIVLPHGTSRERIAKGLDPARHDPAKWAWAFGVGDAGLSKLRAFVEEGGTLVAIGSASETARELFDLPIEKALPESQRLRPYAGTVAERGEGGAEAADAADLLRRALQSPARLMTTLRDEVVDPESLFYCPGSLLAQEFDTSHPIAYGMPERWPVFFESDQAYRLTPGFQTRASVVSRYPAEGSLLESGWLLGEEYLRNQANAISFEVGKGTVVVLASQVDYRTQPRATFKLLFNAIYQGPATAISASELASLRAGSTE
jgi:hypothetical protein